MNRSIPGLPVHHQLPEFTQTHVHWVNDAIQPSHPLSSPSPLAPIPPSIRVFSNESILRMRWPKYWSFSFSIIPFKEIPGLISFRMNWLNLLAVQGTLKSLLQGDMNNSSLYYIDTLHLLTKLEVNVSKFVSRSSTLLKIPGVFQCFLLASLLWFVTSRSQESKWGRGVDFLCLPFVCLY